MRTKDYDVRSTGGTGTRPRRGRLLLGAAALAVGGVLATGSGASAQQCSTSTLLGRLLCSGTPAPAPTTPTTVAPVVSLPPVTLPPVTIPPVVAPPPTMRTAPEAARRLLDLTNAERQRAGLGGLTHRDDVAGIAIAHSERMAQSGDIFHNDNFFGTAVKNLLNAGARGENVAYNGDIDAAHARLMASAGHRANILDGRFSVAGFGVVQAPDGRYFITENFIQPAGAPRAAAPRPARTAAPAPAPAPKRVAAPAPARAAAAPPTTGASPTTVAPPPPAPEPAPSAPAPEPAAQPLETPVVAARTSSQAAAVPLGGAAAVLLGLALLASVVVPLRRRSG